MLNYVVVATMFPIVVSHQLRELAPGREHTHGYLLPGPDLQEMEAEES